MADIAILVAEEYERRTKNPRRGQEMIRQELQELGSSGVSISATATSIRMKKMMEMAKKHNYSAEMSEFNWVFEPKSQIGRAASTGFFSA
ncbi:uncharacterized protein LOC105435930 [Cucumis sativus]|uniref:Uncharacterized protein n=1 Tax=Cucumis sativus TaxID=3659 RepID=A0A0A0KK75_CUCSA|nr:uncharacterized protein LOC105435930 [Cucumis sativus]KGN48782.1 hypothetical protein Csa_003490 [Cucumis sativus]